MSKRLAFASDDAQLVYKQPSKRILRNPFAGLRGIFSAESPLVMAPLFHSGWWFTLEWIIYEGSNEPQKHTRGGMIYCVITLLNIKGTASTSVSGCLGVCVCV